MTITLPEADIRPRLAFKDGGQSTLGVDEAKGEVTAIVSVTGVVDEVDDLIVPGAYAKTLQKRTPKVCDGHDWAKPVGRVIAAEEWMPGDSRLPAQTPDGKAWPAAAGALVVTIEFNMKSERGRQAFEDVRFYSESGEAQWSIGYQVPPGKGIRDAKGQRRITEIDLYTTDPVLFGAAPLSMTLALKSALGRHPTRDEVLTEVERALVPRTAAQVVALAAQGKDVHPLAAEGKDVTPLLQGPPPPGTDPVAAPPSTQAVNVPGAETNAYDTHYDGVDDNALEMLAEAIAALLAEQDGEPDEDDVAAGKALAATEVKYDTSPVGDPGGQQNWVDKTGGLPPFIRAVAHALIRGGRDKSSAIAIAVGRIRDWASGKGKVSDKTRAKAQETIAQFDRQRAEAHAPGKRYDPALEVGPDAGIEAKTGAPLAGEMKSYPYLPGTIEERLDAIRGAVTDALRGEPDENGRYRWDYVSVDGTRPDGSVFATRCRFGDGPSPGGGPDRETFEMTYRVAADGTVTLGDPTPVELRVVPVAIDQADAPPLGDHLGLDAMVTKVAAGLNAALTFAPEGKAGRVLSGANEQSLRAAVEHLIAVLHAAGVEIDVTGSGKPPAAPGPTPDTTAIPQTKDGLPDVAAIVAGLREGLDDAPETKGALAEVPDPQAVVADLRAFLATV